MLLIATTGVSCIQAQQENQTTIVAEKVWESEPALTTSESVCFDIKRGILYVSCINGNPLEHDGNGFIAKVGPDGTIIESDWVTGLDAPKGMGIFNDLLYVTDIDRIAEVDISGGKILRTWSIPESRFLNDISIDSKGGVFFSDMSTGKIHLLGNGVISTWIDAGNFRQPNGLLCQQRELLVGTAEGIYSVRYEDKRIWHLIAETGSIDGLVEAPENGFFISDWAGKVQWVAPDQSFVILFDTSGKGINAADIEYNNAEGILYVPNFAANKVTAWKISVVR
ncbi:MAG: hypothetical protein Kow00127_03390 [Bacteroidales bacterium]